MRSRAGNANDNYNHIYNYNHNYIYNQSRIRPPCGGLRPRVRAEKKRKYFFLSFFRRGKRAVFGIQGAAFPLPPS